MAHKNDPASTLGDRTTTSLADRLAPYQSRIETELVKRLEAKRLPVHLGERAPDVRPNGAQEPLASVMDPIHHVVAAGGKRIRPVLCLLAAEAISGEIDNAVGVATGIEYLHTFTLVHDDVMDEDLVRRGRPTVHALWGAPMAITAGDGLYALSMSTLLDPDSGADPATLAAIARQAARVSFALCAGQTRDLLFESRDSVTLDEYHQMIEEKTAVLMGLSTETGARIAGASDEDRQDLHEYGMKLGLAFQVTDDLLDLQASEQEIGKPPDSDLRAGKKTYPIVHALDHLEPEKRDRLKTLLGAPEKRTTPEMVQEMRDLLSQAGSLKASSEHAKQLGTQAKDALARFKQRRGDNKTIQILEELVDHVIQRRH